MANKEVKPTPEMAARHLNNYLDLLLTIFKQLDEAMPKELRRQLLLIHILKAETTAEAALLLGKEWFVEEVFILNRTLSEIVVNACYLLVADDLEVTRFTQFDLLKGFSRAEKLRRHSLTDVDHPVELVEKLAEAAKNAETVSKRTAKDNQWSQHSLEQRAEIVDAQWNKVQMKTLVLSEGAAGHPSVHATLFSMKWEVEILRGGGAVPDRNRSETLGVAVLGTAFCLFQLCIALNERFDLGHEATLAELNFAP